MIKIINVSYCVSFSLTIVANIFIYNEIIITSDKCQVLLTCEVVYAGLGDKFQLHDDFFREPVLCSFDGMSFWEAIRVPCLG